MEVKVGVWNEREIKIVSPKNWRYASDKYVIARGTEFEARDVVSMSELVLRVNDIRNFALRDRTSNEVFGVVTLDCDVECVRNVNTGLEIPIKIYDEKLVETPTNVTIDLVDGIEQNGKVLITDKITYNVFSGTILKILSVYGDVVEILVRIEDLIERGSE